MEGQHSAAGPLNVRHSVVLKSYAMANNCGVENCFKPAEPHTVDQDSSSRPLLTYETLLHVLNLANFPDPIMHLCHNPPENLVQACKPWGGGRAGSGVYSQLQRHCEL